MYIYASCPDVKLILKKWKYPMVCTKIDTMCIFNILILQFFCDALYIIHPFVIYVVLNSS